MKATVNKIIRIRARRRGLALLIVMMLSIAMAVIVWSFQRDVQREVSVQRNVTDNLKAELRAEMGVVRGQVALRLDEHTDYDSLNESWSEDLKWEGESFGAERSGGEGGSGGSESGGPPQVIITDEDRKFNLLTLVVGETAQKTRAKEVFTRLLQICRREDDRLQLDGESRSVRRANDDSISTNQLVSNLIKYLEERASEDSDDLEFTLSKSSKADQRSMRKQTPFKMLTLGELLQIEGWTNDLLYGAPRVADGEEGEGDEDEDEEKLKYDEMTPEQKFEFKKEQADSVDQRSQDPDPVGIYPFLTLYSGGLANINTASRELILALDERLTWEVVDKIITAREQDRQDLEDGEDTGAIEDEELTDTGEGTEEEDMASYRPEDIASFQAFVARTSSDEPAEGEQASIEDLTEAIYTAIRPWLTVRSTIFSVESSATIGKRTHSIKVVYRRTGSNQQQSGGNNGANGGGNSAAEPAPTEEDGLPAEPEINLTLLFRDIADQ